MREHTQHEILLALAYKDSQRDGVRYQVYGRKRNGVWVYTWAPTFSPKPNLS